MVAADPAASFSCRNSSTGPIGQLTGSTAWTKHPKTFHLEEYNFLVAGALALPIVYWTSAGRLAMKTCGPGWAIPTASRSLVEGARSYPEAERTGPAWSESPKGADIEEESALRTTSGMARMGLQVGDGHRSPSPCTGLPESAWNLYSLMSGQGWANASMPRGDGELRENQSGHWDDFCDAKRSTEDDERHVDEVWDLGRNNRGTVLQEKSWGKV